MARVSPLSAPATPATAAPTPRLSSVRTAPARALLAPPPRRLRAPLIKCAAPRMVWPARVSVLPAMRRVCCPTAALPTSLSAAPMGNINSLVKEPTLAHLFLSRCSSCKQFPAFPGSNAATSCPPVLTCDSVKPYPCLDGTCVSEARFCRPVHGCPAATTLCLDNTCRADCTVLAPQCPPASPTMCPSGACKQSYKECENMAQKPCPEPMWRCADGTCAPSLLVCAQKTFQVWNPATAFSK